MSRRPDVPPSEPLTRVAIAPELLPDGDVAPLI
jgi:hypothetical protein